MGQEGRYRHNTDATANRSQVRREYNEMTYSAKDMEVRGLRIQRQKNALVYKHNGQAITKDEWTAIAEAPPPEVEDGQ